jgi:hypothetical protein
VIRLIAFYDAFILRDRGFLRGKLLLRNGVLGRECFVTGEIGAGVFEESLVAHKLRLRLVQRDLIGARVDLDEKVTLNNWVAFTVLHLHEFAIHAGSDVDGIERCDGSQAGEVDADVAAAGARRDHGNRGCGTLTLFPLSLGS